MRGERHISEIVLELEQDNLLPAIIFRTARMQCDHDVEAAAHTRALCLPAKDQAELENRALAICKAYDMETELVMTHPHYSALLRTGIGAHHAGQLLMWRLLLEELMAGGVLRVLIATGTVAAGVDFPARTVVITAHSKRGAEGFNNLTAAEFQQMSGRAGRRGRDTVGFCLAAPAPFCDARALLKISKQPPEPLASSYFPGPSTVLNLLRYRNVDDLRYTVSRSLASFFDRKQAQLEYADANRLEQSLPRAAKEALARSEKQSDSELEDADSDSSEEESPDLQQLSREHKKLLKRVRRTRRQGREMENRQVVLLNSALEGLEQLGYIERTSLSEKGFWAANLCTSLVLELGEIIQSGLLDGVSAERLAALIGSLSGDEHRRYLETKNPPLNKDDTKVLNDLLKSVSDTGMPGVQAGRKALPAAANTVVTWMHADDWKQFRSLLILSGVAEGDAARLITQTAEHLNQITRLDQTHRALALRAEEAKRRILRPPLTEVINLDTI